MTEEVRSVHSDWLPYTVVFLSEPSPTIPLLDLGVLPLFWVAQSMNILQRVME